MSWLQLTFNDTNQKLMYISAACKKYYRQLGLLRDDFVIHVEREKLKEVGEGFCIQLTLFKIPEKKREKVFFFYFLN